MDKEECILKSTIKKSDIADCYIVKVASQNKWIGSPTNTLTSFPQFAACIDDRERAEWLLEYHCNPENSI